MSQDPERVFRVTAITTLVKFRTDPPILLVRAQGLAGTTGWTNPALIPRVYASPPADGLLEFDFMAVPPTGVVLPMLTSIAGEAVVNDLPDWVRGVRIIAETDSVEQLFPARHAEPMAREIDVAETASALFPPTESGVELESLLVEEEEGYFTAQTQATTCREFLLASVNIPEVKTEWEVKCIAKDPFSGRCLIKTKVPVLYRRTSKLRLLAKVCVPDGDQIWDDVADCVKQAVAAGVAVGVLTSGNLAAAAAALQSYLLACLKSKLGQSISDITADLKREKITGAWQLA